MSGQRGDVSGWFGAFWFDPRSAPWHRLACGSAGLLFLAYPLADLAGGRRSGLEEALAAAGLAAFIGLYLRLFWILPWLADARRAEGLTLVGAIAALAVSLAGALGGEWIGLLVYLSVAAALALPMRVAPAGVATAAAVAAALAGADESVVLQALMFGVLVLAVRRLAGLVAELDAARARVAELAISEERLRLSRDLHDLLGHNLSVIALKGELARRLIERDEPLAAAHEIHDVEAVARQSLQEAREAVRDLRRGSLATELERARDALEAASIEATVRADGPLPEAIEAILGFAVREATTNVIRHSGARRCELAVRQADETVELEVHDDGAGVTDAGGDGSGLRGLGERLAEAGGTLQTGCAPDGGFRLVARVPVPRTLATR
ncbi:MAG: sensor histidine kinase [Actinobacteria bacterium]|nr:sensor histidine kinase [Actinomycetota bacterium]